jgi:succinate dehydrogenase / fumarate reductase iron-sulfur subunit
MDYRLRIKRFIPERDDKPWWGEYTIEAEPTDRVLDALHTVKWYHDGTLAFRRSCAHGICGSDAMRINGANRLACQVLLRELDQPIVIEPLLGFEVLKDLIIDMEPFFAQYRSVMPYLVNMTAPPERERIQTQAARARYDDTTKCILCAACTTACPSFWPNKDFIGPAAIVQAHRFIFDDRDHAAVERLAILSDRDGVFACRTIYNCTRACPRGIKVTRAIGEVKKAIVLGTTGVPST